MNTYYFTHEPVAGACGHEHQELLEAVECCNGRECCKVLATTKTGMTRPLSQAELALIEQERVHE